MTRTERLKRKQERVNDVVVRLWVSGELKLYADRGNVYKTAIKPEMICPCETFTLTKCEEMKLNTWEQKILRKIFGANQVDGFLERKSNQELWEPYQDADIVASIKMPRLRWLEHVQRTDRERTPKVLLRG